MSNGGGVVMLCAMFVIVFVCIQRAVKEMSFFGDAAGWGVAFCAALLSIVGLVRFFGSPGPVASRGGEPRETGGLLDVVLLPYVALALTILLVLLLLAVGRVFHSREPRHPQEPARNRRTVAEPYAEVATNHRKETKLSESSERRPVTARKAGKMIKKTGGTRSDL
jgi:hypothetical protein